MIPPMQIIQQFIEWPGLWLNLARLLTLIFTSFIAWMTYRSYVLIKTIPIEANLLLSLPELIVRLGMVGFCLFLAWMSGLSMAQLGLWIIDPWRMMGWGLAVGVVIQLGVNVITLQAIRIFGATIYSAWLIRNILPRHSGEWPWLVVAFIPPVLMEELLFRTLLLGLFQAIVPLLLLIPATSIVFGLMHQPQGKLGMVIAGAINVAFCILFVWSGQLLLTFVAHYTINLLQVVLASRRQDWLENY